MTKEQIEMLSVKNAIERSIHNYIMCFKGMNNGAAMLADTVERLMASFFAGRQIDDYLVTFYQNGRFVIQFSIDKQQTSVTFFLPLQGFDDAAPQPEPEADTGDSKEACGSHLDCSSKTVEESIYRKKESEVNYLSDEAKVELKPTSTIDAYEKAKKHVEGMNGLQTYADGDWQA